ncbi:TIGR03752 family integrating conjugative element protein [Vreelandella nigrificans]|uniref:TIGR03752 family integrating conjugative element protein n=1 Tax=Vreelandella nigrificans TaxID=2042704 RepID=A0A2A4HGT0_9GAMM|nr:TIGR03752 family integrating conjugative element protein [Halomonas nigrificans]PCF94082.1 TIGR03752 family integrating conjugative element protein [Halomonas nigrificans]
MTLKSNGLLKILIPVFVVIVIVVMLRACSSSGTDTGSAQNREEDPTLQLTQDELRALGVEGDTPQDTVATLVGQVQAMRSDLERTAAESEALRSQNERLTERTQNVDQLIHEALRAERERQQNNSHQRSREDQSLLSSVQRELSDLRRRLDTNSADDDLPIGLGLEGGGYGTSSSLSWVDPIDAREMPSRGSRQEEVIFPTAFGEAAGAVSGAVQDAANTVERRVTGQPPASTVEPVYTVPQNSTLMGSLSMTALIGRVPVDGTVTDPYPFKVIVGPDNLTANGIELPEVQSAIMSGTASGDWTLSCVRGDVHSITFVFEDGTVRTLPEPDDVNSGGGSNNASRTKIGWLSDSIGIPCVSGQRSSNAKQFLGTQALLTAAGAGVATLMSDDSDISTTFNTDGSVSTAMSGSQAAQQIMASGVNDMSRWVNRLYGEAFAAIFVPPGRNVAIHIDRELQIDYETQGRRVHYDRDLSLGYDMP